MERREITATDIFNAGMLLRRYLVEHRFYQQSEEFRIDMLRDLKHDFDDRFEIVPTAVPVHSGLVQPFLQNYAITCLGLHDGVDYTEAIRWGQAVFFCASPHLFARSFGCNYLTSSCPAALGVTIPENSTEEEITALWNVAFEKYLWEAQDLWMVGRAVRGNIKMSTIFNSVVENQFKIAVYDEATVSAVVGDNTL